MILPPVTSRPGASSLRLQAQAQVRSQDGSRRLGGQKYVSGLGISIVTSICLGGDEPGRNPLARYFGLVIRKGKFLSAAAELSYT